MPNKQPAQKSPSNNQRPETPQNNPATPSKEITKLEQFRVDDDYVFTLEHLPLALEKLAY